MGVFLAAVTFQLAALRHAPGDVMALVNVPLYTTIFLAITTHAERDDLVPHAVLAPAIMGMWLMALLTSAEIIERERWNSTLEALLAAPARLLVVLMGRISVVTLLSLLAIAESWLVARAIFGLTVHIYHPAEFLLALLVTAFAIAGTATALAAVFVLTRSARMLQHSLSYPFYLLGGAFVPVDLLPNWLRPASLVVFMSWSTDLLRDTLSPPRVSAMVARAVITCGLGTIALAVGLILLDRSLNRARALGTLDHA